MDSNKAGTAEDLDNEKLQLICKAYNRRLLSSQRVVDGINSMDYSKLKILCKYNNKFSYKGIEELLSDESIVNHINDYDDEMFRSMLNDAPSERNILEILKGGEVCNTNNEFESSDSEENEEDYGYYDNSDYEEDEKNDLNNFAKEALENKGTNEKRVDDVQFYINEEILKCIVESYKFSDKEITKLLENKEILERINSVAPERFQLILNSGRFNGTSIIGLLESQNAARNIDLIDKETLKYIIENDKFSLKDIIKLLEDLKVVERINLIAPERFQLILSSGKFYGTSIIGLLESQNAAKNIDLIDEETFKYIIIENNNLSNRRIIKLLENQEVVERINSMNRKIFDLIFIYTDQGYIMNLLKDQSLFDQINSLDDSKVSIMKSDYFFTDKEITEILKTSLPQLHSIDGNRLKIICKSVKFDSTGVREILEDQSLFVRVNSIDLEKLQLISSSSKFDRPMVMDLLKSRNFIDSINTEKFRLLLDSAGLNDKRIITLLKDQEVVERINSIDAKRFKLVLDNMKPSASIIELLENQDAVKYINSVNNEELEAIMNNITGSNIVNIFTNLTPDIKSTLRFVIPLLRTGKVTNIDINYLSSNKNVHTDIIEHLYSKPSIELLIKHYYPNLDIKSFVEFSIFEKNIACEEPVSKLYNLSLEQVIENINPHKRARYS